MLSLLEMRIIFCKATDPIQADRSQLIAIHLCYQQTNEQTTLLNGSNAACTGVSRDKRVIQHTATIRLLWPESEKNHVITVGLLLFKVEGIL